MLFLFLSFNASIIFAYFQYLGPNKLPFLPCYFRKTLILFRLISGPWFNSFHKKSVYFQGTLAFGITAYDDDSGGFDVVSNMAQNISINATQFGLTQKTMVALEGEKRSDVTPKLTAEIRYWNCFMSAYRPDGKGESARGYRFFHPFIYSFIY